MYTSLKNCKAYDVDGVDRTAPVQPGAPPGDIPGELDNLGVAEIPRPPQVKDELPKAETTQLTELASDDSDTSSNLWLLLLLGLAFPLVLIVIFFRRRNGEEDRRPASCAGKRGRLGQPAIL